MTRVEEIHGIRPSGQVADTSSVNDLLATLPAYTPALAYLLLVCGFLTASGTCPTWVHPVALVVGVPARGLSTGWVETGVALGSAGFMFVFLVYFAGRSVSGATLFSLVTTLALTPTSAWPALAAALLVVAVVAVRRTLTGHGRDRVAWIVMDTAGGLGLRPGRGIGLPSADLVPTKESFTGAPGNQDAGQVSTQTVETQVDAEADNDVPDQQPRSSKPIYLPPYLMAGVVTALVCAVLLG